MSEVAVKERPGQVALRWWGTWISADTGAARALAARLRRAPGAVAVLSERPVQLLFHDLSKVRPALGEALKADPGRLVLLVRVLAHVDAHQNTRLARLLGRGEVPPLSPARFERLMRIGDDWDALAGALIRVLPMTGSTVACNVAALADDLLNWGDDARTRWCFDYFGSAAPEDARPGNEGDKE